MGIWLGPRGKPKAKRPPAFISTGVLGTDYLYAEQTDSDGTVHFEIAVLKPCAFTFSRIVPVDLCLVGSGENGSKGEYKTTNGYPDAIGGPGGAGGKILRALGVSLNTGTSYLINPGENGADTTAFGYSSANGTSGQSPGGRGARMWGTSYISYGADPGADGEYAFGEAVSLLFSGRRYAAGGGGAGCWNYDRGNSQANGGDTGGGEGGTKAGHSGANGAANTGSGAGGGYTYDSALYDGGVGGSGIVLIRDAR